MRLGCVPQHTHTLHHQIVLAAEDPSFWRAARRNTYTHMSGKVNYGAYLVREMTVWLLCFSDCCIPPFAAFFCCCCCCCCFSTYHIISFFFSYPYTPHSFRSWIGSIHREARLGYGYRKDRVFRDENGYHVCEFCSRSLLLMCVATEKLMVWIYCPQ